MAFDAEFETNRLSLLAEQFLRDSEVVGRVVLINDELDESCFVTSWSLQNADMNTLRDNGFKSQLIQQLQLFMAYRRQEDQPNSKHAVIWINGNHLSIEWLPPTVAHAMRNSL